MTSPPAPSWLHARGSLALDRPRLMGIVNLTPDSFFDGSRAGTSGEALAACARAVDEGADILDLGAESTRPGAASVPPALQIERLAPVVRAIRDDAGAFDGSLISVDTTRAEVARRVLDLGADIINDVSAGTDDDQMFSVVAATGAGLILMHRLRRPEHDSYSDRYDRPPRYQDVVGDVSEFLAGRLESARVAGIDEDRVILDPGLGFGKTVEQNLQLVAGTARLLGLGRPVLSALSRKSFVGRACCPGRDTHPGERLEGTLALSTLHLSLGARVFRVHDVEAHARALSAAWSAVQARIGEPAPGA